jgi:hypothetical protein
MNVIFNQIGVEPTKDTKKDLDRKIHSLLDVEYKNCSSTWKLVKSRLDEDREGFIEKLKNELS